MSTAYHPQTDGQTERINQEIEQYLRVFCNWRQDDWDEWLPMAELCYNDREQSSTGYSPFFLSCGFHPRKATEPVTDTNNEAAGAFFKRLNKAREDAISCLKRSAELMKTYYDRKHSPDPIFKKGELVYIEGRNIRTERPSTKLGDKRYGPFAIEELVGSSAYRVRLPKSCNRVHPVFHVSYLRKHHDSVAPHQKEDMMREPATIEDGAAVWDVEAILDSRMRYNSRSRKSVLEYKVKWATYPVEEATWEPKANLGKGCRKIINLFHKEHPNAPREVA